MSITAGSIIDVYDIGVDGLHEFTAEGVIVHNCWLYHPETEQRFLLDIERRRMGAPDFLDYKVATRTYDGLMESWQRRSEELGCPITHWVVEQNAAQRFLLQYDHVKNWARINGVSIVGHDTHSRNKSDHRLGVTSIAPHWKYGRVRLPEGGSNRFSTARAKSRALVAEATRYRLDGRPHGTDDCVMAQWIFEWNLPYLHRVRPHRPPPRRPSWMRPAA